MIQYLIAGLVGGAIAMAQKPKKKGRRKYAEGGKTREVRVYSINELDDSGSYPTARDRALDKVREGVFMFDWWDYVYDDAKRVGVTISGFDLGRRQSIDLELDDSPEDVCQAIIDEHGDADEEPRIILAELMRLNESIDEAYDSEDEEDSNGTSLYDLEDQKESVEEDLITYLKQYYYTMLQREYDGMNEDDYLIEHAEANDMEFDKDGYIFRYAKGGVNDGSDEMLFVKEDDESMELYIFKNANGNYTWRILYDGEIQEQGSEPTKSEATSACIEALGFYRVRYAKGGRVSTYEYEAGRNPKRPFDVLGRKDGMVMYHTTQASVKDSADKAEELLENGYDEVLIAQS